MLKSAICKQWEKSTGIHNQMVVFLKLPIRQGSLLIYLQQQNCALAIRLHNEAMKTFLELYPKNPIPASKAKTDYDALLKKHPCV